MSVSDVEKDDNKSQDDDEDSSPKLMRLATKV